MRKGNKDILSTFINQGWRLISGPMILLLIPLYLTSTEQGCWYTFTSLAALSIFADIGFGTIILQFAAHEFSALHFMSNGLIDGPDMAKQRLATLFKFTVKWGVAVTLLAFPIISIGGYFFLQFQLRDASFNWEWGWILYSGISGIIFFNNILLTFFEGCNSVARLQGIRFKMAVASSGAMLLTLITGVGIYALVASGIINAFSGLFFLYKDFKGVISQLWKIAHLVHYNWWPEFSRLIWRYALGWYAGYWGGYAYTPIAFYCWGPVAAGRVGLSIAIWSVGFGIANCWLSAIIPRLNMLIEQRDWENLDQLFKKNFYRAIFTMMVGGGGFLLLYAMSSEIMPFWGRVLNLYGMTILFFCWLGQIVINGWATYLRAHKKEPLMVYTIIGSLYIFITTLICSYFGAVDYMFVGYLSSMIWGIPFVWRIYYHQKKAHI